MDSLKLFFESQQARAAKKAAFEAMPLIEQNTQALANLEREWAMLGPLRLITFTTYIGDDEDIARSFANELEAMGFNTNLSGEWPSGSYSVHATRTMEPTAENVTHWQEWFLSRIAGREYTDETRMVSFTGWSYPKRETPTFSLETKVSDFSSSEKRGQILFGQTLAADRVSPKGKYDSFETNAISAPFRFVPSQFLSKARAHRPRIAEPTASKFAQWLYSLYADAYGSAQDREEGKEVEAAILTARRKAYSCVDANVLSTSFPDWRLVHNGMHISQTASPEYFTISELAVAGEALRVLPDLMYRNRQTGDIMIVEIKNSRLAIPSNLWPNIWGQLWCYAQIEQVRKAPRVTVIGEVWADAWTPGHRGSSGSHVLSLRASVRRDPRDSAYDRFFRTLFDIYRGADCEN